MDCISDIYSLASKIYGIENLSLLLLKQDIDNVIVLQKRLWMKNCVGKSL